MKFVFVNTGVLNRVEWLETSSQKPPSINIQSSKFVFTPMGIYLQGWSTDFQTFRQNFCWPIKA